MYSDYTSTSSHVHGTPSSSRQLLAPHSIPLLINKTLISIHNRSSQLLLSSCMALPPLPQSHLCLLTARQPRLLWPLITIDQTSHPSHSQVQARVQGANLNGDSLRLPLCSPCRPGKSSSLHQLGEAITPFSKKLVSLPLFSDMLMTGPGKH